MVPPPGTPAAGEVWHQRVVATGVGRGCIYASFGDTEANWPGPEGEG